LSPPRIQLTRRRLSPPLSFVATAALTCASCVIPVGPQFQDPLAAENYTPVILASKPPRGTVVMAGPANSARFSVTITDPNVGDTLRVRWMANYPDYKLGTTFMLAGPREEYTPTMNGMPWSAEVVNVIDCLDLAPARLQEHQISVTVADRPFQDVDYTHPLLVAGGGKTEEARWTFFIDCSLSP
jgi:hypothetical protein